MHPTHLIFFLLSLFTFTLGSAIPAPVSEDVADTKRQFNMDCELCKMHFDSCMKKNCFFNPNCAWTCNNDTCQWKKICWQECGYKNCRN